jgi:tetraacyldisaccharide 4'-kinase
MVKWVEQYLFFPNPLQKLIGIAFLPLTVVYCVVTTYKRVSKKPHYFGIPVISIGNILLGGTGKTPVAIALAKPRVGVAIVLRGYGRDSKGLYVVSNNGKILEDINISGDEATLLANSLPNATIIVSENRAEAIFKAKELGCKVVFLDDGFSQHHIQKYNILLRPKDEPTNIFCLPTGGYRDTKMNYSFVDYVMKEGVDFKRDVKFILNGVELKNLPKKTLLLTAISKPNRLLEFLPKDIKMISFPDHYNFTLTDIENIENKYSDFSIVTTSKDMVKLNKFNIKNDIYLMDLELEIDKKVIENIDNYIKKAHDTKNSQQNQQLS